MLIKLGSWFEVDARRWSLYVKVVKAEAYIAPGTGLSTAGWSASTWNV